MKLPPTDLLDVILCPRHREGSGAMGLNFLFKLYLFMSILYYETIVVSNGESIGVQENEFHHSNSHYKFEQLNLSIDSLFGWSLPPMGISATSVQKTFTVSY